jgi:hypothetical protein
MRIVFAFCFPRRKTLLPGHLLKQRVPSEGKNGAESSVEGIPLDQGFAPLDSQSTSLHWPASLPFGGAQNQGLGFAL